MLSGLGAIAGAHHERLDSSGYPDGLTGEQLDVPSRILATADVYEALIHRPDPTPGKNKVHLDLSADDLDGEVERLVGAGASLVERRGDEHFRWVTLADPDGNQFCVAAASDTAGLD